jgi:hypothetical protein
VILHDDKLMLERRTMLASMLAASIAVPYGTAAQKSASRIIKIPIRMTSNRLWTTFTPTESEKYIVVIDTGSIVSLIAKDTAQQLKLRREYSRKLYGLGGSETGTWVEMQNANLGGAYSFERWWFFTSETLNRHMFKMLFGISDLMAFNAEFNLDAAEWRLHDNVPLNTDGYSLIKNAYFTNDFRSEIQVDCKVADFAGTFQFDTGSPTNFLLDAQATAKLKIWDSGQPYVPWRSGGIGKGNLETRLYRLQSASVHGVDLKSPLVMLTNPKFSSGHIEGVDGLIGLKAIRHFNFLTDRKNKQFWLKRNSLNFEEDTDYPKSGLWLEEKDGAILVQDVGIGSPAAAADIRVGDLITGNDWRSLITQINGEAGELIALDISRGGAPLRKEFTLTPYL